MLIIYVNAVNSDSCSITKTLPALYYTRRKRVKTLQHTELNNQHTDKKDPFGEIN